MHGMQCRPVWTLRRQGRLGAGHSRGDVGLRVLLHQLPFGVHGEYPVQGHAHLLVRIHVLWWRRVRGKEFTVNTHTGHLGSDATRLEFLNQNHAPS